MGRGMWYYNLPTEQKPTEGYGEQDPWGGLHWEEAWHWESKDFWIPYILTHPLWEEDEVGSHRREGNSHGLQQDYQRLSDIPSHLAKAGGQMGYEIQGGPSLSEVGWVAWLGFRGPRDTIGCFRGGNTTGMRGTKHKYFWITGMRSVRGDKYMHTWDRYHSCSKCKCTGHRTGHSWECK